MGLIFDSLPQTFHTELVLESFRLYFSVSKAYGGKLY